MQIDHSVLDMNSAWRYWDSYMDKLKQQDLSSYEQFTQKAYPFMEKYGYFMYPASVKYHLNQEGGLFRHSVKLVSNALALNELWFQLPEWKVVLAGIFHDLGKLGNICLKTGQQWPRYKKNWQWDLVDAESNSFWIVEVDNKTGFSRAKVRPEIEHPKVKYKDWIYPFTYGTNLEDKTAVYMDMTDLDAILPVQLMTLPVDVIQACKFADGLYVATNKTYGLNCHPLSHLIHWSDMFTGIIQEGGRLGEGVYGIQQNRESAS